MPVPAGWFASGSACDDYEICVDRTLRHSGTTSALIRAKVPAPRGSGMLMQDFVPESYRGRRVRLSGWVRTEDVAGWCGLWMRVDGHGEGPLAFDNMRDRAITGTTPWARHEVVLDVAETAKCLAFGIILEGPGSAWLDEVALDVVGPHVPTTGEPPRVRPNRPRNLSFEE